MTSRRITLPFRALLLVAMAGRASLPLAALDQAFVRRGTLERQGRAWIEKIECGAPVRERGRLVLRADFGAVSVRPGTNDRMECTVRLRAFTRDESEARRDFESYDLGLRMGKDGSAYLNGKSSFKHRHAISLEAEFEIAVPRRFNLDLETQAGSVDVEALDGDLRAVTAGGDIHAGNVNGNLYTETAGGSINLGNVGRDVKAETAGGSIHVGNVGGNANLETSGGEIQAGLIGGALKAETAGGDIILRGASGPVQAETAGGQILVGECAGSVSAETAGGSIRLEGARGKVKVETAGGSIDLFRLQSAVEAATAAGRILAEINARRENFGASKLETSAGDVQVFLPPDLPLTIDAAIDEAAAHNILSDFPLRIEGSQEDFAQRSLRGQGNLNGGGKVLRIRTVAGNIEIRRLDPGVLEQLKQRQQSFWKRWQERHEHDQE